MAFVEGDVKYQKTLATKLAVTSDLLCGFFPEEISPVWHVVKPRFRSPGIFLMEHDISPQLMELANQSRDFFVSFHAMAEDDDDDRYCPPCHIWEIRPPTGINIIGRSRSSCFGERNLGGLCATLYCAQIKNELTLDQFRALSEDGYFNSDRPAFFKAGEEIMYDPTKPEGVLMEMIGRDWTTNLEVGLWILESIRDAEEIHPEEVSFEIHEFWTEKK